MTSLTEIFVTVKPDMDKFGPEVKKRLSRIDTAAEGKRVAGRFGVGFHGAFGGIAKRSAGLFLGAFAVIKGAQVFGSFIADAQESAKVARISAAVIKSTGGAAGITAAQMGTLSTAISNKTGADDEAIQSGENLLATFTGIKNQVGKGNDIFNQASATITDMAAALNNGAVDASGLKSSSIQLGKALNDPIKGVTALQKVGVSFTASQKAQIKTMVASGNTLGAQKIILGELQKEFGGAAAAAADPLTRLKVIAGNLSEQIGGYLLPIVGKFADYVASTVIPKISDLSNVFVARVMPKLREFGGFIRAEVLPRLVEFGGFFRTEILPRLLEFATFVATRVVPAVARLVGNLVSSFAPAVKSVFGFFKTEVLPRLRDFAGVLGRILPKVGGLATSLLKNKDFLVPFAATILAVVAAIKTWSIIQAVLNAELFANPIGLVVLAIAALVGGLVYAYKNSDTFRKIVNAAFKVVAAAGKFMWDTVLKPALSAFVAILKFSWGQAQLWGRIIGAVFTALKGAAVAIFRAIVGAMLGFISNLLNGAAKAFGWVPGIGGKLKSAAKAFGTFRDNVNAALSGIKDQTISIKPVLLKYSTAGVNLTAPSSVGRRATGGSIFGPGTGTSDSIPAMLSNGEHVWTAKEVTAAGGHGAVEAMRKQVVRGYATGGGVTIDPQFPSARGRSSFTADIAAVARAIVGPAAQAAGNAIAAAAAGAGNGGVSPGLAATVAWGKSQAGKPYVWGSAGPGGFDCSGFVGALVNYAKGRPPNRRIGATGSMPWSEMTPGVGPFMVGWFKGNPGHTAATINGVNMESSGGRGVHYGPGARGANNSLFTNRMKIKGFAGGGAAEGRGGDAPFDLLDPRGERFLGKKELKRLGIDDFDSGGRWKSGTLGVNLSGKTETVIPGDGAVELGPKTIHALAAAIAARPVTLDGRRVDEALSRRAMGGGY